MNTIINEEKINNFLYIGDYNNNPIILSYLFSLKNIKNKFFIAKPIIANGISDKPGTLFILKDKKIREIILSVLQKGFSEEEFTKLIKLFSSFPINDYLKLRGDFAEAAFLKEFGGKKIEDEQKYDILIGNKYVEIKSFSSSIGTVKIKNSQINKNNEIVACELIMDNKGFSIIELANLIDDYDFKEELVKKYKNTLGDSFRFSYKSFFVLKPDKIEIQESMQDVDITFFVSKIKGKKYEKNKQ